MAPDDIPVTNPASETEGKPSRGVAASDPPKPPGQPPELPDRDPDKPAPIEEPPGPIPIPPNDPPPPIVALSCASTMRCG
jgi:hypothetical protein